MYMFTFLLTSLTALLQTWGSDSHRLLAGEWGDSLPPPSTSTDNFLQKKRDTNWNRLIVSKWGCQAHREGERSGPIHTALMLQGGARNLGEPDDTWEGWGPNTNKPHFLPPCYALRPSESGSSSCSHCLLKFCGERTMSSSTTLGSVAGTQEPN